MSNINQLALTNFQGLFSGNTMAYGQHTYGIFKEGEKERDGKSWTKNEQLKQDHYREHLIGNTGLGIVPINNENKTKFIVIDIDIYKKGIEQLVVNAIDKSTLPLTVFTTKSGGYHIYLFFKDPVPVPRAKALIEKFIRLLAIDNLCKNTNKMGLEIFPKQSVLNAGSKGSWINLPYYAEAKKEPTRQVMLHNNRRLDLEEALTIISREKVHSLKELELFVNNLSYSDAPPCLQSMFYLKNIESNRNNYLFTWGVYFKNVDEDNYESEIYKINKYLSKPLPESELEVTVIASVRKKAYSYKCNDEPCQSFCNKTECKTRKYGIGDGGYITNLTFGDFKQIQTTPPIYEWVINDKVISFKSEDEIIDQSKFRKLCMRILHYAPYRLKEPEWLKIVNDALQNVILEAVDYHSDISPGAQLKRNFAEFILNRAKAATIDQVSMGRVYDLKEQKGYFFRAKDLTEFLFITKQFRDFNKVEVFMFLREIGCLERKEWIYQRTKQIRGYLIPYKYFEDNAEYANTITPEVTFEAEELIDV